MGRPFDSTDSPLMRQPAFSQFGGTATRDSRLQMPKDGAADAGASDPVSMLMQYLSHPALGPILRQLLSGQSGGSENDAIQRLRALIEPTSLDSPQMMANRKQQMDLENQTRQQFINAILQAAHQGAH